MIKAPVKGPYIKQLDTYTPARGPGNMLYELGYLARKLMIFVQAIEQLSASLDLSAFPYIRPRYRFRTKQYILSIIRSPVLYFDSFQTITHF